MIKIWESKNDPIFFIRIFGTKIFKRLKNEFPKPEPQFQPVKK